ncbi:MAG: hypothetical protein U1E05_01465, partial [Patescibacteria group bacterium]|nr:hypothetical protein [Patescibacteria group bacterium]
RTSQVRERASFRSNATDAFDFDCEHRRAEHEHERRANSKQPPIEFQPFVVEHEPPDGEFSKGLGGPNAELRGLETPPRRTPVGGRIDSGVGGRPKLGCWTSGVVCFPCGRHARRNPSSRARTTAAPGNGMEHDEPQGRSD